jgi:rod shape-determining protein MreD
MSRQRALPPMAERALFVGLGVVAVQAALVPLGTGSTLVAPDLLYGLTIAWVIRRPATAPLWAVLSLGLFADVMLSRPLGLGALGLVLASEWFRLRARRFHGAPFFLEWLAASAAFAAILAGIEIALALVFADRPGAAAMLRYGVTTALAYPLIVFGLTWCLHLRAPRSQAFGAPLRPLR